MDIHSLSLQKSKKYSEDGSFKNVFVISALAYGDNIPYHGYGYTLNEALAEIAKQSEIFETKIKHNPSSGFVGIGSLSTPSSMV